MAVFMSLWQSNLILAVSGMVRQIFLLLWAVSMSINNAVPGRKESDAGKRRRGLQNMRWLDSVTKTEHEFRMTLELGGDREPDVTKSHLEERVKLTPRGLKPFGTLWAHRMPNGCTRTLAIIHPNGGNRILGLLYTSASTSIPFKSVVPSPWPVDHRWSLRPWGMICRVSRKQRWCLQSFEASSLILSSTSKSREWTSSPTQAGTSNILPDTPSWTTKLNHIFVCAGWWGCPWGLQFLSQ